MVAQWPAFEAVEQWMAKLDFQAIRASFERDGFAVVPDIVPSDGLCVYADLHDRMTSGEIDATSHRHDLGAHRGQVVKGKENVGQIQWPMDFVKYGRDGPLHQRAFAVCRALLGDDTAFDFDMTIWKNPHTATETPWHQDEAYWPSGMTDKRAITLWCALDDSTIENGTMWFLAGSHKRPLLSHRTASEGSHILMTPEACEATPGATCVPLKAGSAVLWHGRTCHYARGNITGNTRRTFIVNFRPESMVEWERLNGFDHLRFGFENYEAAKAHFGDAYKASAPTSATPRTFVQRHS